MELDEILAQCLEIVKISGKIIRESWNQPHQIKHKGAIDLVTETDVAVQKYLASALAALTPEIAFVGEEGSNNSDPAKGECWIVDPIDGTTNFIHGVPVIGTSLALCRNGRPVLSIVNAPLLDECFYAIKDKGAFLNGKPVSVSKAENLAEALVATGFPYEIKPALTGIVNRLERILPVTQGLRRLGAASIDLAYVACGRMDIFYEEDLKPWDFAGGWLLVEEAGGKITDFEGHALTLNKPVLASNGRLHKEFIKLLSKIN